MKEKFLSILIVGTGATACLFAARLCAAGFPVTMLGSWVDGLRALRQYGVRLVDQEGNEKAFPVRVISHPGECEEAALALVLVKSWQTEVASRHLAECLAKDGLALTLQNGIGNLEMLANALGEQRVALGTSTVGAYLLEPGKVKAAGDGVVTLGVHARLKPLVNLLTNSGFIIEFATDLESLLWGKLVINASINPLTALLRVPNGVLLERLEARLLLGEAAKEAAEVAEARGVHLPYSDPSAAAENVARRTAKNLSSMLQDVLRGAPTEIDSISGAIVKAAEENEIPVPINRTLWLLVKSITNS